MPLYAVLTEEEKLVQLPHVAPELIRLRYCHWYEYDAGFPLDTVAVIEMNVPTVGDVEVTDTETVPIQ